MSKRKILIAANWKSNGEREFVNKHCMFLSGAKIDKETTELCIAPPNIHLLTCNTFLAHLYHITAQNISQFDTGPYTGEVSAKQIKDLGVDWTIIGHSERRKLFNETEQIIGAKIEQALQNKLKIIFCIGDDKEEKANGKSFEIINNQMQTIFDKIKGGNDETKWGDVVIAYEPLWETSESPVEPTQAEEIHKYIRGLIGKNVNENVAEKQVRIIYGGKIDENNCKSFIQQNDIDGFLIGEISLTQSFNTIVETAKK